MPAIGSSGVQDGVCYVYVPHTTAGVTINENADPSVLTDFESMFNHLVQENLPFLTHTLEGPDDMPAHIRSVLTGSELTLPVSGGRPTLGTWQGVYLWEHRRRPHRRSITVTVMGEA